MPGHRGGFRDRTVVTVLAVTLMIGGGSTGTAAAQSSGSAGGQGSVGTGSWTDGTGSDGTASNGTTSVTGSLGTGSYARSPFGSWMPSVVGSMFSEPDLDPPGLETLRAEMMPSPLGEPFFDEYPPGLDAMENGEVIETRDVTPVARQLLSQPVREVRQFKVRTTDAADEPSFATATLVVPAAPWPGPGPRPVVVNNVPINGLGRACTPSYTLAHGITPSTNPYERLRPVTTQAEQRGYAVLITDHEGPRMAYGEPIVAGRAILDVIRGMRNLYPAEFGDSKLALTGYSGGSIATHGAVKQIDSYAPELADDIVGAAIGGLPADFEMLGRTMNGNLATGYFLAALFGVMREHPETLPLINPLGQRLLISTLKDECISDLAMLGILLIPVEALANVTNALNSPVAHDIYAKLKMADLKSGTPLYIFHGGQEFWVPALGARNLFDEQCGYGVATVYQQVPGEHIIAPFTGTPGAFDWIDARLAGEPPPSDC
ncbi:lipase family protein [Rhodococcus spongiicola]|uniref:Lipase n=1 Tax=Rhodococcus spongiicola TaxID=2487352 RepID=A0A438AUF4_9NOCA|nr:lipase family protein [Rhodococcus spongiicola]RVW02370.1 lipase [Rhodococcus spongiicola]